MKTNSNIQSYLDRIGYTGDYAVSVDTLSDLHQAHALCIPFENLDVINGVPIKLNQERFYEKIVGKNRGGLCYEVNGLFKLILDKLGFESWFISCQVFFPKTDTMGPDLGHVAIVARLQEALFLVDVGFGRGFLKPLKLNYADPQFQSGTYYRFSPLPQEKIVLERSTDGQVYEKMYQFSLAPRLFSDFEEMCQYHQRSPLAPFNQKALCTRPTLGGRITLTASSLVITENGHKQEEPVCTAADFWKKLQEYFGIAELGNAVVSKPSLQAKPG